MNIYSKPSIFNPVFYPYKPAPKKQVYNINRRDITEITLQEGNNGVEVEELQQRLIDLKYLNGTPDGYFGKSTKQAVLNFQQDVHQVMDGVVGTDTWNLILKAKDEPLPISEPTLKVNDENLFVTNAQIQLTALGYYFGRPSGRFDNSTVDAVKKFQNAKGLTVDGIIGPNTWRELKKGYLEFERPVPIIITPMLEGTSGEEVLTLQSNLQKLGYYNGEINGLYDVATGSAVIKFQSENNQLPTGIVNQSTWELIEEKVNNKDGVRNLRQKKVLSRGTIRNGDTGEDVVDLQRYLKELGYYDTPIDGVFGNSTNLAVRSFQNNNKLSVDGIVGRNTWSSLINLYSHHPACGRENTGKYVGVVIDSGHGGSDPGAVNNEILEKNLNLQISDYLANRFKELGVPYKMTRSSDETLTNAERIKRIKSGFGDVSDAIVISNHINAGGGSGAEVIYPLRSTPELARNILTELGNAGSITRTYYQRTLPNDPTKDYYYLMRDTDNLETLIVEYAFIDNPTDIKNLQKNLDNYAEAVVKAVTEYMGYTYVPSGEVIEGYKVQKGDTLYSIANRFNTTVSEIKRLNNLTSDALTIGQTLLVKEQISPKPPIINGDLYYKVVKGDTLWSIAKQHNTTVDEIKRLNNLNNNNLEVGDSLLIVKRNPEESSNTYVVQKGDTLFGIASRFGISISNLRRINNLTTDNLTIGQVLRINEDDQLIPSYPEMDYYIVQSGDTLYSIAHRFNKTVSDLKRLNNLSSDVLTIGQKLIITEGLSAPEVKHTVKSGDTLWSLAREYQTSVNEIKRLNNLMNDNLTIGMTLIIKDDNRTAKEKSLLYIVTPGNTLWTIAKHFNLKVDEIKRVNNLSNNRVSINQELKLPIY